MIAKIDKLCFIDLTSEIHYHDLGEYVRLGRRACSSFANKTNAVSYIHTDSIVSQLIHAKLGSHGLLAMVPCLGVIGLDHHSDEV